MTESVVRTETGDNHRAGADSSIYPTPNYSVQSTANAWKVKCKLAYAAADHRSFSIRTRATPMMIVQNLTVANCYVIIPNGGHQRKRKMPKDPSTQLVAF